MGSNFFVETGGGLVGHFVWTPSHMKVRGNDGPRISLHAQCSGHVLLVLWYFYTWCHVPGGVQRPPVLAGRMYCSVV